MQRQEGLFSVIVPLKDFIKLLKQEQSAASQTKKNARTQCIPHKIYYWPQVSREPEQRQHTVRGSILGHIFIDCLLSTRQKDSENSCNTSWDATEVNIGDSCTGNEMCPLLI